MLLFSAAVYAQPGGPSRKTLSFGPIMGYGHGWTTPTKYSEYKPALSAGAFAIYSPVEHWGLGMDVRYSIEGSTKDYPEGGTVKIEEHYLRVPLRVIYFGGSYGDDFRPKLALGPSMGFLIGYKAPQYISANGFDFGLLGSAGFNYRITDGVWFNTDVSYYHGFSDVIQHTSNREQQRNLSLNLGIGIEI